MLRRRRQRLFRQLLLHHRLQRRLDQRVSRLLLLLLLRLLLLDDSELLLLLLLLDLHGCQMQRGLGRLLVLQLLLEQRGVDLEPISLNCFGRNLQKKNLMVKLK
jgi:hypothetical protein